MAGDLLYLDASALVKRIRVEPETEALRRELAAWPAQVTSVVGDVEARRAARRARVPKELAEEILATISRVELDEGIAALASQLDPAELRALDAIHLASAISLEDDLGAFACYDVRLAAAAEREGIRVLAPR